MSIDYKLAKVSGAKREWQVETAVRALVLYCHLRYYYALFSNTLRATMQPCCSGYLYLFLSEAQQA